MVNEFKILNVRRMETFCLKGTEKINEKHHVVYLVARPKFTIEFTYWLNISMHIVVPNV